MLYIHHIIITNKRIAIGDAKPCGATEIVLDPSISRWKECMLSSLSHF